MRIFRNLAALSACLGLATIAAIALAQNQPSASAKESLFYAIVYRAGPNWRADVPMERQGLLPHFNYMRDLHARGTIVLAGPLGRDGGLVVIHARNQAEADGVIAADPAVTAGLFTGEARSFTPRFVINEAFTPTAPRP